MGEGPHHPRSCANRVSTRNCPTLGSIVIPALSLPARRPTITKPDPTGTTPLDIGAPRRVAGHDYADAVSIYFVTICASSGTAPFTDDRLAQEVIASLHWLRQHRGILLYSFCLMPDHLHLLLRLGSADKTLGELIGTFKSFTTRQSCKLGYRGQLWQARFYDHILRKSEDGGSVAEYMRQNPVRKGLVRDAEEYPYSGMPDPM